MKPFHFPVGVIALLVVSPASSFAQLSQSELDDIGFTSLQDRLGAAMPTGAGISVSQIEALESNVSYRPDISQFVGYNFVDGSGGSTAASGHATAVGQFFYGSGSIAPAIGTGSETILTLSANQWINFNLNAATANQLPLVENNDVQNSSWVGNSDTATTDINIVRRLDYAIQRDDFVAVVGLNNGGGTTVPDLLAGAYNGITVGLSNGNHSSGTTQIEGVRTRPDLVVPTFATSYATPVVSSAAALLIETARSTAGLANAERSFVIKSLLMAGASRNESEFTRPWANSPTQPLDVTYGAGELDIDNSYQILTAGEGNASTAVTQSATGWDLGTTNGGGNVYYFEITGDAEVSAALVWNRLITATDTNPGPGVSYQFDSTLADLDLHLRTADGFTLGSEIAASLSTVDNVELITAQLATGRYAWEVTSGSAGTEYGIAWQAITVAAVPEVSSAALVLLATSFGLLRRRV